MAKRRHYTTTEARDDDNGLIHCGVISREDILRMERRARREADIQAGAYTGNSGGGVHGGDKKARTRRDRRENKQLARNWDSAA